MKLFLLVFIIIISLQVQAQNRFTKLFIAADSVFQLEQEKQYRKIFDESVEMILSMNRDSITIPKKEILLMCWSSYIDGACSFREKGDFDDKGLLNDVISNKAELEGWIRMEKFWKKYYKEKMWTKKWREKNGTLILKF